MYRRDQAYAGRTQPSNGRDSAQGDVGQDVAPSKPRPHQTSALHAIRRELAKSDRAQVVMPCGTGKSHTEMWAAQDSGARSVLVLVPTLALLKQAHDLWWRENDQKSWGTQLRTICVCSDASVGRGKRMDAEASEDDVVLGWESFPTCTDAETVADFLSGSRARGCVNVVFATYASAPVVALGMSVGRKRRRGFDLAIFDEAHKSAGQKEKLFGFALDDENIHIRKRLFFTATPRVVGEERANDGVYSVSSMDDESLYGRVAYYLSFKDAVAAGLIVPYKIVISVIVDGRVTRSDIQAAGHDSVASQWVLREAMDKHGIKKAITFHSTVGRARAFADSFHLIPGGRDVEALHVSGTQTIGERSVVMRRLKECRAGFVTNARCLTEGVDVPAVDGVAFVDRRRSPVDIVQAIGRALRVAPGKEWGHVLLPLHLQEKVGEDITYALDRTQLKCVTDVLRTLFENDEDLHSLFLSEARSVTNSVSVDSSCPGDGAPGPDQRREGRTLFGLEDERVGCGKGEVDAMIVFDLGGSERRGAVDLSQIFKVLKTKVMFNTVGSWYEVCNEYAQFVKVTGREPKHTACGQSGEKERRLAQWASRWRSILDPSNAQDDRVRRLNEIAFRWGKKVDKSWKAKVEDVKLFVQEHGFAPRLRGDLADEVRLHGWLSRMKLKSVNGWLDPELAEALRCIPLLDFGERLAVDHKWQRQFEQYEVFVRERGIHPAVVLEPSRRYELRLARWALRQVETGKKKLGPSKLAQLLSIPGFPPIKSRASYGRMGDRNRR